MGAQKNSSTSGGWVFRLSAVKGKGGEKKPPLYEPPLLRGGSALFGWRARRLSPDAPQLRGWRRRGSIVGVASPSGCHFASEALWQAGLVAGSGRESRRGEPSTAGLPRSGSRPPPVRLRSPGGLCGPNKTPQLSPGLAGTAWASPMSSPSPTSIPWVIGGGSPLPHRVVVYWGLG